MMKQYYEVKKKNWDKLVAFKMWKFYYFYFNDALAVHRYCDIPLNFKNKKFFCFFHETSLQKYAPNLVDRGYKIVLVEQMEETIQK